MFTQNEYEHARATLTAKIAAYRAEAEVARLLPKHSLRRRIAVLLRAWAESLEPQAGLGNTPKAYS